MNKLLITRSFDAPLEKVRKARTDPVALAAWRGPKNVELVDVHADIRSDGEFRYGMQLEDDSVMRGKFVFKDIIAQKKITFISGLCDELGNWVRHPMIAHWPMELWNELIFSEYNGKTTLLFTMWPHNASEEEIETFKTTMGSAERGLKATFEHLDEYLTR